MQRLVTFVHAGGQLIAFNSALKLIARAFHGRVAGSDRQLVDFSRAPITVVSVCVCVLVFVCARAHLSAAWLAAIDSLWISRMSPSLW